MDISGLLIATFCATMSYGANPLGYSLNVLRPEADGRSFLLVPSTMENHADPDDWEQISEAMKAGVEDAYLRFSEHFGPKFYAQFRLRGLSPGDAEDLAISCVTDIALKV